MGLFAAMLSFTDKPNRLYSMPTPNIIYTTLTSLKYRSVIYEVQYWNMECAFLKWRVYWRQKLA